MLRRAGGRVWDASSVHEHRACGLASCWLVWAPCHTPTPLHLSTMGPSSSQWCPPSQRCSLSHSLSPSSSQPLRAAPSMPELLIRSIAQCWMDVHARPAKSTFYTLPCSIPHNSSKGGAASAGGRGAQSMDSAVGLPRMSPSSTNQLAEWPDTCLNGFSREIIT